MTTAEQKNKFNKGDLVKFKFAHPDYQDETVIKKITEVRQSGYSWVYADIEDSLHYSENSNDPFMKNYEVIR